MEVGVSRWDLSEQRGNVLDRMWLATAEAMVFRNITIILTMAVGRTKASITSDLRCNPDCPRG